MSIEAIRHHARKALHDTMSRRASLFLTASDTTPDEVTARYHSKTGLVGDLKGTNLSYAENHDDVEKVILWRSEIVELTGEPGIPPRGALLVFDETEGYWFDNVLPPDGQTVSVEVTRASTADITARLNSGGP